MIHGFKRTKHKKTQEEIKSQTQLSQKIAAKLREFFAIPRGQIPTQSIPKYLQFVGLLMQLVTDIMTVFNFRRELVESLLKNSQSKVVIQTLAGELKLTTKLIQSDPKSYTIWSYRQWIVKQFFKLNKEVIKAEKQLTRMLLLKDEKNFHVWNYRNWLNSIQLVINEQIGFTEQKMKSNPFNFSAYHFRSKFINQKYSQALKQSNLDAINRQEILTFGMPKQFFQNELQKVKTAVFLNPNEEAPWLYYNWLLAQLVPAFVVYTVEKGKELQLYLNMKTSDFSSLIVGKQVTIAGKTGKNNSECWIVNNQGQKLSINSNLKTSIEIKLQNTGRLFLGTQYDRIVLKDKLKSILLKEIEFIDEVIQSEEEQKCRFAYLQKSAIYKLLLQCGTSQEQFAKIVNHGRETIKSIEKEPKANKYILKQLQYWQRLSRNELTPLEAGLKMKLN